MEDRKKLCEQIIKYIDDNWVDSIKRLSPNFIRSNKTLTIRNQIIEITDFLDKSTKMVDRLKYIRNNKFEPNTCKHCNISLYDKGYDIEFCSKKCYNVSVFKKEDMSRQKRKRDLESPFKEMTLEWWQWKYGTEEGKQKYIDRNKKLFQSEDKMIEKYGEVDGKKRYQDFISKISNASSLKYYITKYGDIAGPEKYNEFMAKKKMNLFNFIRCYGEIDGPRRFDLYKTSINQNNKKSYSKISQELFWNIVPKIDNVHNKIYFAELNKEFNKFNGERIYFYDFVDTYRKKVIEFNGNIYHANPKIYKENEYIKFLDKTTTEIWEYDKIKIDFIQSLGYDVLVIWESDYLNNKSTTITECINFLLK